MVFSDPVVQVMEKLASLQAERERMEDQWKGKQSWLEAVHLEQIFYRDVNAMDKTSNSQEVGSRCCLSVGGDKTRQVESVIAAGICHCRSCCRTAPWERRWTRRRA